MAAQQIATKASLLRKHVRNLEFDALAFEDFAWWVQHDRKKALRLIRMIQETQADPFSF